MNLARRSPAPWGAATRYKYLGRTVRITGPKDAVTIVETDPLGRPVTIIDPEQGKASYSYGPFGGLLTMTDPGDAVTTTERDAFGRVRKYIDPDRGTTDSSYSGFGDRVYAKDAANREYKFYHDGLGRVHTQEDDDGTTTWFWDTAAKGVGQLGKVTSPKGHEVTFTYDSVGRPKTTTRTIDGEAFTTAVEYDAHGRVSTITYPEANGAPFAVAHEYDDYGHLRAVKDAQTGAPYWQLRTTDEGGRINEEQLGDGAEAAKPGVSVHHLDLL